MQMASAEVQKATYGSIDTSGARGVKQMEQSWSRTYLGVVLIGLLCAVGIVVDHIYLKESGVELMSVHPGSVFEVGEGKDRMALTVDSEQNSKGYVHAYGYKNGIKYAGMVKLTQKRLRGTKLSGISSRIRRGRRHYEVERVRSGTFDVERQDNHNLTTYLVEVHKKPTTSLGEISDSAQPAPCAAPSCSGLSTDYPSSSTIQGSSSAIQNQRTVNINMIGFAGASTSVSNGPNNYFGGSFPQNPQPNNNFYGSNTGGGTPGNNNFIAGNLPFQQESKPRVDAEQPTQRIKTGPQYEAPYPNPPNYQAQQPYQSQYPSQNWQAPPTGYPQYGYPPFNGGGGWGGGGFNQGAGGYAPFSQTPNAAASVPLPAAAGGYGSSAGYAPVQTSGPASVPLPVAAPAAPAPAAAAVVPLPPVAVSPPAAIPQVNGGLQGPGGVIAPPAPLAAAPAPAAPVLPPAPAPLAVPTPPAPVAAPIAPVAVPPAPVAAPPAPIPAAPGPPAPAPVAAPVPAVPAAAIPAAAPVAPPAAPVPPPAAPRQPVAPIPAAVPGPPAPGTVPVAPISVAPAPTVPEPIALPPASNKPAELPPPVAAPGPKVAAIVPTPPTAAVVPVSPVPYDAAVVQASSAQASRYYPACDPTNEPAYTSFTMCLFRSEVYMDRIPIIAEADSGLNRLYFVGKSYIPTVDLFTRWDLRSYIPGAPDTNIAWAIYGKLYISLAGTYTICSSSDDGTKVYLDGPLLVTNDFPHGMVRKCGTTTLSPGAHTVYVEGYQGYGPFGMELTYSGPDTSNDFIFMRAGQLPSSVPPGGQYYPQCNPNDQPNPYKWTVCTFRSSININAIPSIAQADTGINRLYFIGKGQLAVIDINDIWGFRKAVPQTIDYNLAWAIYGQLVIGSPGSYTLCTTSDDGTKLYVDGPYLLADNDGPHGMLERCGTISLAAGAHTIYVEGYDGYGGMGVKLTYQGPDTNNVRILMPSGRVSSPYDPSCDPMSLKEPAPQFTVCIYSMDQWLWNVPRVGDAAASQLITLKGKGYMPVVDVHSAFTFQQYVPAAPDWNYVWAIFGHLLIKSTATYTLCINSDDGSQLFVDGALLINDDGYHGMIKRCESKFLPAGRHLIYLAGMQGGGGVGMELTYSGPDTGSQEVFVINNALPATDPIAPQYFPFCDPRNAPVATKFTLCTFRSEVFLPNLPKVGLADTGANRLYFIGKSSIPVVDIHGSADLRTYIPGTPNDNIVWVVYGHVLISSPGTYEFCTTSDDGSKIFIDGPLLVQNDWGHGMLRTCGTKSLTAGYHMFYSECNNGGGPLGQEITYSGPDTANTHIFLRSGQLPPSGPGSQYYSECDPNVQPKPTKFTVCIFRSSVDLGSIPSISLADTGKNRLYYVGKGSASAIDITTLERLRDIVPKTPNDKYVWAMYGTLVIGTAGTYKLCTNSDDGSKLYVDGPYLLVDNEGLHGPINKCGSIALASGNHIIYVEGFQNYGGIAQRLTYSGPDTADVEVIMPSGRVSSQYYKTCDPTQQKPSTYFQMCLFSAAWLPGFVPRVGDAVATKQISYLGQGSIPVIDVHDAETFKQYVTSTPDVNYVWAISGYMLISSAGTYNLCINSDDGSQLFLDGTSLVVDDGWHGMIHRCGNSYLTPGYHMLYLVGFQGGGGVGMELTYSGPDTASRELFIRAGSLPAFSYLKAVLGSSMLRQHLLDQLQRKNASKAKHQKLEEEDAKVAGRPLKSALVLKHHVAKVWSQ